MDIHKPKSWHGWRDFIKEIGTIVIGVSIALAAEQAVERSREHRQYLESREAMRTELGTDVANFVYRPAVSACAVRRIAEIGALLDKAEAHQAFEAPSWIGEAVSNRIRYAAEGEAARSGLFSPNEQRQFSAAYGFLHDIDTEMDRERQAWGRLQQLTGRTSLPPETIANLRQALAEAAFEDRRIQLEIRIMRLNARPLALETFPPYRLLGVPQAWPFCLPMNTPREEGLRRTAYPKLKSEAAEAVRP